MVIDGIHMLHPCGQVPVQLGLVLGCHTPKFYGNSDIGMGSIAIFSFVIIFLISIPLLPFSWIRANTGVGFLKTTTEK